MNKRREWLVSLRGKLTQQEVADKAKIDRSYYTHIESGARSPSVETAKKIAKALKFKWTKFFEEKCGESEQKPKPKAS